MLWSFLRFHPLFQEYPVPIEAGIHLVSTLVKVVPVRLLPVVETLIQHTRHLRFGIRL